MTITKRGYLAGSLLVGLAAVIVGILLAAGNAGPRPVIAVAGFSAASPTAEQITALIAAAHQQRAEILLLEAPTWQQADAADQVLGGKDQGATTPGAAAAGLAAADSLDVSVVVDKSGLADVVGGLPASARVIDVNGNLLRPGPVAGGPGLLVLVWGVLVLVFAFLVTRTVAALRTPAAPPGGTDPALTAGTSHAIGPVADAPAVPAPTTVEQDARQRHLVGNDILARYLPAEPLALWERQCPRCGSFTLRAAAGSGCDCLSCGYRWPDAAPEGWPDVVVSHRRRGGSSVSSENQ